MVEYKGNDVHLKLLAKDDEVDEQLFNFIINTGVTTMRDFLKDYSEGPPILCYYGIIQQFCAWTFWSSELYGEIRHVAQQRCDDYNDAWRMNYRWYVVESFCNEHVKDALGVIGKYDELLSKAPSVLRFIIPDLVKSSNNDEKFADACVKRIWKIKGIFKRLGILR